MDRDKAIVVFKNYKEGTSTDLEIPLNISANELVIALNTAFQLNIDVEDIKSCYLKAENPIVLLRGNRLLSELGVRNGTIINFTD